MTTVIVPLYGYVNSGIKRFWNLARLAKKSSLTISSHDEAEGWAMAVDVVKRKLLFVKKGADTPSGLIIDLDRVERCTIKKEYNNINAGGLKTKALHQYLKCILLQFVFKTGSAPLALSIFDGGSESQDDVLQLEAKAMKWAGIISKIKGMRTRDRP